MNHVSIQPSGPIVATVEVPGSKSLTQRHLICAALAEGRSRIRGALLADDTQLMIAALRALEFEIGVQGTTIEVVGGGGQIRAVDASLNVGHAGTAMRFLAALLCLGQGLYRIDGSARMRQRPIGPLVDALGELGAQIGYDAQRGFPPLTIVARGLAGGPLEFRTPPSSQFISAILMVSPYALRDVLMRIDGPVVSGPYVEMTVDVMRRMGVELLADGPRYVIPGTQRYRGGDYAIEPDASAATYFFAAAAITGGKVRVNGLTRRSAQGDVGFVDVLRRMGCTVTEGGSFLEVAAPRGGRLRAVDEDLNDMPDSVQTLAVTALFADGVTHIRNVANLRIKETDRIAALAAELARLGARVDVRDDGLSIFPPERVRPAEIRTYDDHRMAMSLALAGLAAPGVVILNPECVSKSFPDFFESLARACGRRRGDDVR
ncbi:MAG: 3-phosphoshikimate 1-carboxyvinyltransferase [Phycisphaerae bacterium]|nr:3-phosphoshikimate 1-carboxyvinyltransferase [Phycisphaerae bacterium]